MTGFGEQLTQLTRPWVVRGQAVQPRFAVLAHDERFPARSRGVDHDEIVAVDGFADRVDTKVDSLGEVRDRVGELVELWFFQGMRQH